MRYDERYEPYFESAGLLPFVLQFKRVPPVICHSALTALLDRWRSETHSFHLPYGEMTVTLEDFAMITGLPLHGQALTGRVDNKKWRQRVTALIGDCSSSLSLQGKTDNRTNGVPFKWLEEHRSGCPEDANEETVEQYARAYVWHFLSQVVFQIALVMLPPGCILTSSPTGKLSTVGGLLG